MRAAVLAGPHEVRVQEVPEAAATAAGDAVVQVVASCICGSDLWAYRGVHQSRPDQRLGHEFVGIVSEVGPAVAGVRVGDFVIAPFSWCDGTCPACLEGLPIACDDGGFWGQEGADGGQGEAVRVPYADATLVVLPETPPDDLIPALLSLSDVMCTGHYAAVCAGVTPGSTVVVVGDGAVGLCGVLAARRLGAERVIVLGRNPQRISLARQFGATDVVSERGREAVTAVRALTDGRGAPSVLECVGTQLSLEAAAGSVRKGGRIGYVGVPHVTDGSLVTALFRRNATLAGGGAPARRYIPELLGDVLAGRLDPSPVFNLELPLADIADGYRAMDERSALKVLIRP